MVGVSYKQFGSDSHQDSTLTKMIWQVIKGQLVGYEFITSWNVDAHVAGPSEVVVKPPAHEPATTKRIESPLCAYA